MSSRLRNRSRQKQINILHTATRKRHSQKQMTQTLIWAAIVMGMLVVVGLGLHLGIKILLDHSLYQNPRYALTDIDIEPRTISTHLVREAAGLEPGENLWTLNLPQIVRDLEKLPQVSSAKVERQFPNKVTVHIVERIPMVKIVGLNVDLGTRETFYLDHDCIVLKPRENETAPELPEVVGLVNAELEPGMRLDQPMLSHALDILDAIDHTALNTAITIRTIDLSQPLAITMTTTHDMAITFRPDYVTQQLARLEEAMNYADTKQATIHTIDLTPDKNVPVTFYQ